MTVGIIDLLQVVHVTKQQQEALCVALRQFELLRRCCKKTAPVEQAGKIIRDREKTQLSVEKGLLNGVPDCRVSRNSYRLLAGAVDPQQLGNLVDLVHDLAKLGV